MIGYSSSQETIEQAQDGDQRRKGALVAMSNKLGVGLAAAGLRTNPRQHNVTIPDTKYAREIF